MIEIGEEGYLFKAGEHILGSTLERVTVPYGYWAMIETRGKIARAGISVHNSDAHIDPGYSGFYLYIIWQDGEATRPDVALLWRGTP